MLSDIEITDANNLLALFSEGIVETTGKAEGYYGHSYTEYSGYQGTGEEMKVGGHDLYRELSNNIGRYVHMEITVH